MAKAPSTELQQKIVSHVMETFNEYNTLLKFYRKKWYDLFKATYVFETDRKGNGQAQIFFPKAFENVEKLAPRITGNEPKFVLGLNLPKNEQTPEANMLENQKGAQMSLNYFWKMGDCQRKVRNWVKQGLIYGTAWAKVNFEVKTVKTKQVMVDKDDKGDLIEKTIEKEVVALEYPTFDTPDVLDIWFDPRVEYEGDRTAIIENTDDVRIADIVSRKDIYFNLNIVKANEGQYAYSADADNYKLNRYNLQGIPTTNNTEDNKVNFKTYYGYFSESGKPQDEKLIMATVINGSTLIRYEEIEFIPFEKFNPLEVPGQAVGVGVVEPIKKLQDAYNLTRNQRYENVSMVLNRMWLMRQGAGIDPRRLVSKAGNVIPVRDLQDIAPLQTPDVTGSAYSEAQAINTEIQTTLGTIDTTSDSSSGGFTNLATGQKIRWNEYNVRFKAIKQNFEEALAKLGEKMLLMTGQEATKNPIIKDTVTQEFFEIAKTAFDNTSDYYSVSVVADSTAMDSIENQREEALGFGQLAIAYKAQGVNVAMDKVWDDIVKTFQKNPQDYMGPPPQPEQPQGGEGGGRPPTQDAINQAMPPQTPADQLNQDLTNI